MIQDWIMPQLERVRGKSRLLVRDPMKLLPLCDARLREFCDKEGFALVMASTNLVFRQQYDWVLEDAGTRKLLVVDQAAPHSASGMHAPAPFYPDLLAELEPDAHLELNLRDYLRAKTGDPHWPSQANDRRYARLIVPHLEGVLRAHQNLRNADPTRFTDPDLNKIVAYAALGIPHAAFRTPTAEDYLRIGLFGLATLDKLDSIAPEVTRTIREELRKAPAPFCWFGNRDAETVVRTFYLCVLLAQHSDRWKLLAGNMDHNIGSVTEISEAQVREGVASLVEMNPDKAESDLSDLEASLTREHLEMFLVDEAHIGAPEGWAHVLEQERYSTLIRSLALLLALDDRLSKSPDAEAHMRIERLLSEGVQPGVRSFVENRASDSWVTLREIYLLVAQIAPLVREANSAAEALRTATTFADFWKYWNEKKINRLEYYFSRLERLVTSSELLPVSEDRLPALFITARTHIEERVRSWREEIDRALDKLNTLFQTLVAHAYPNWVAQDSDVRLTAQFIRRCLKPNWDPQTERAVLFIFDGMRYDIWDEMLRPMMEERMDLLQDYPASSILPSETQLTRKAISAGDYPDTFSTNASEGQLLQAALARDLGYHVTVETISPNSAGTGETVRYRAGNLDVVIFELCDKALHGNAWKKLPDGREVPGRPLSLVYEQQIKSILEVEVRGLLSKLAPGTKVFVTADHGFGRIGRKPIWFQDNDLNDVNDVKYLNAMLGPRFDRLDIAPALRNNLIGFRPEQLRMPSRETIIERNGTTYDKEYGAIVFPKVGYSLKRTRSPYNPDAYSHGGISLPELLIPMVVLQVRDREAGLVRLRSIEGPSEVVEGEEAIFQMHIQPMDPARMANGGLRLDVEASYSLNTNVASLPPQVQFLSAEEQIIEYRFRPSVSSATPAERQEGRAMLSLSITVRWRDGSKQPIQSRTINFAVRLTPEQIVRRVGNLGSVLGLTPRSRQ